MNGVAKLRGVYKMARNLSSIESSRIRVPGGLLSQLVTLRNDLTGEIRMHTTDERFLPPSIKISNNTKKWFQSVDDIPRNMYLVRGPDNIQGSYYGVPGSQLSIVPTGGLAALGGPITYAIIDGDDNLTIGDTTLIFPAMDTVNDYRIFAVDNYGNYSYVTRFSLRSVTSDIMGNDMIVGNVMWTVPDHVAKGGQGVLSTDWVISSLHTNAHMEILTITNGVIEKTRGINKDELITYHTAHPDLVVGNYFKFTYRLYTEGGNVSTTGEMSIPIISNTPPKTLGMISNLPTQVHTGQQLGWIWGGGVDLDQDDFKLDVISINGATLSRLVDIAAGEVVPLFVTGMVGTVIKLRVTLHDAYARSETFEFSSIITADPPDISLSTLHINDVSVTEDYSIAPCGIGELFYDNVTDTTGSDITVSVSSTTSNVSFSTTVFTLGEKTVMQIPCGVSTSTPIEVNAVFSNGSSSSIRTDHLSVTSLVGHELVNTSRTFIKPAGVTDLTVIGSGGIGQDTVLGGGISYTFVGVASTETQYPPPETLLFNNLPGGVLAITVTLAPNTVLNFHWS
jgi:hypothetical protein